MSGTGTGANGTIELGISPCPNDTFSFYALLKGKVPSPCPLSLHVYDVEELNRMVLAGELDVSKVSYHLFGHVIGTYVLLRSGSALGWGCGPLLVARKGSACSVSLEGARVAIPGEYTTAAMLLRLYAPGATGLVPMFFADIPRAVASGRVDAGVIIHESRFTYRELGLACIQDLGAWWESNTRLPIPLGGIVAKRSLGRTLLKGLEEAIRNSIKYAFSHRNETVDFVKAHAQETSREVIDRHISLYVNEYSLDLGTEGIEAVRAFVEIGADAGVLPARSPEPIVL